MNVAVGVLPGDISTQSRPSNCSDCTCFTSRARSCGVGWRNHVDSRLGFLVADQLIANLVCQR